MSNAPNVKALSNSLAIPMGRPGQNPILKKPQQQQQQLDQDQLSNNDNIDNNNPGQQLLHHNHRPTMKGRSARTQFSTRDNNSSINNLDDGFVPLTTTTPTKPGKFTNTTTSPHTRTFISESLYDGIDEDDDNNNNDNNNNDSTRNDTQKGVQVQSDEEKQPQYRQPGIFSSPLLFILFSLLCVSIGVNIKFLSQHDNAVQQSYFHTLTKKQRSDVLDLKDELVRVQNEKLQKILKKSPKNASFDSESFSLFVPLQVEFWDGLEFTNNVVDSGYGQQ